MKILFMCVANSARSQLAEGLAKDIFKDIAEIKSAGSQPSKVNPLAIAAMREINLDISKNHSKPVNDIASGFLADMDYVITLCAEEVCPVLVSKAQKLHWPFPDPAGHENLSEEEKINLFRATRDAIKERLLLFKSELGL